MVWLATVSVPVRAAPVFAVALIVIEPFPVPLALPVIDNQDALLVAVHVQPLVVVTETGPAVPPFAATDNVVGLIEYEHDDVAAAA